MIDNYKINIYASCTDPLSIKYNSVHGLKEWFDNGYKLGSLQSRDMIQKNETIQKEWEIISISEKSVLKFPNTLL